MLFTPASFGGISIATLGAVNTTLIAKRVFQLQYCARRQRLEQCSRHSRELWCMLQMAGASAAGHKL
jgi:hypothetical protein